MLSRASATVAEVDHAMADYAFGEVARILYEAIWNEFCDWGIELAKVRLMDGALSEQDREATWWALVEALDTYLRLLHPLMPFVTEAIWGALPHRAGDPGLLIVARWPGAGSRDPQIEQDVETLLDLVRGVRNARSEAKLEPALWLPLDVAIQARLGQTFEALRPAIERLARARPLTRHLSPEALRSATSDGGLAVNAGEVEAVVGRGQADDRTSELDRSRLERELAQAETQLEAARARLTDDGFLAKAPAAVVEGARTREAELADQVARISERLGRSARGTG
jgi:valyl-tRNA synthetase